MSCDTRLWMYRKGESRLFVHPDHVPSSGEWQRFPLPAEEIGPRLPRMCVPEPRPDHELTDQEKLDRMSRQRLMQVAADCGVRFETGWTKAQLKHAIIEVLNDNLP
jgi:hypothetical protein